MWTSSYCRLNIYCRKSRMHHFYFDYTIIALISTLSQKMSVYIFSSSNKKRLMRMRNLIENSMNEECDFCNDIKTFHSISKSSFLKFHKKCSFYIFVSNILTWGLNASNVQSYANKSEVIALGCVLWVDGKIFQYF